MNKNLKQILAQ